MRVTQYEQMNIGEVDIAHIRFDPKCRDDIPKILRGLQHLYLDTTLRTAIFELLSSQVAPATNKAVGRPGMTLWSILVCGVLRLDLNIDYDRLHHLVNHDSLVRQMLGHASFDELHYHHQTLKDNVRLLTPELLEQINVLVVQSGHGVVKKKAAQVLHGRCDSFVVETHVHYPTDINLLLDALRKTIALSAQWCELRGLSDWRQHAHHWRCVKRLQRSAQNKKRSRAQDPAQQAKNQAAIQSAHLNYLAAAQRVVDKARCTLGALCQGADISAADQLRKDEIEGFIAHAVRQMDQVHRRVILGHSIPHEEKLFSLFQPHTEWINKGKAGVPVELGVKVCILEDQHQFILHHQVMQNQSDEQVCVAMVEQARKHFAALHSCSFDKGFHSPANQTALKEQLAQVTLPRKGKLSKQALAAQNTPEFAQARRAHSAVESAINALEVHGLDVCPDHGIDGFKRYVALAVLARNIHRIGRLLWQQDQAELCKHQNRQEKRTNRRRPQHASARMPAP